MRINSKRVLAVAMTLCITICISAVAAKENVNVSAAAKKRVKLNVSNHKLKVGNIYKIKLKNGSKKATVSWKSSNASVVRIHKKVSKGNKAYAVVKGVKRGSAKIKANYKLKGKAVNKLECKITVTDDETQDKDVNNVTSLVVNTSNQQAVVNTPVSDKTAVPSAGTSLVSPTVTPVPTATPVPTPTPVPFENLVEVKELKESKTVPDIFSYNDGTPVTADNWEGRAEEIRQMYQYYMYGMWRDGSGENVTYSVEGNKLNINIETIGSEQGQTIGGSASFDVEVNVPEGAAPEKGWPFMVYLGTTMGGTSGGMPEQQTMLDNGYAVINYDVTKVSSDSSDRKGAFYTLYPYNMKEWREQTGVLMAWAWGAAKILDALNEGAAAEYGLNTDFAIVGGVSRYGKATAITGAYDRRYKIALPTCSGCGGMGVFRYNPDAVVTQEYDVSSLGYMDKAAYKQGDVETLGSIQSSGEAFWFNQRFLEFRSIYKLPFDQYYLSALYASEGRTLMLIGGFNYDIWQNTPSLWYNFLKAKEVFDMLGLEKNIIINLHDASMGHSILNDDVVKLIKYCDEMYNGKDVENFDIKDMQTSLFEYTDTPSGINNKEVFEAQIPE